MRIDALIAEKNWWEAWQRERVETDAAELPPRFAAIFCRDVLQRKAQQLPILRVPMARGKKAKSRFGLVIKFSICGLPRRWLRSSPSSWFLRPPTWFG